MDSNECFLVFDVKQQFVEERFIFFLKIFLFQTTFFGVLPQQTSQRMYVNKFPFWWGFWPHASSMLLVTTPLRALSQRNPTSCLSLPMWAHDSWGFSSKDPGHTSVCPSAGRNIKAGLSIWSRVQEGSCARDTLCSTAGAQWKKVTEQEAMWWASSPPPSQYSEIWLVALRGV